MKRHIYISLLIIFLFRFVCGQDPQFTQFYSNPLYLAPSFAGAVEGSRIATLYRSQWGGITNPFSTYSLSYDHYFSAFNSGVGVLFMKDAAGTGRLGMTNIGIQYSYNFRIFDLWHVRPGVHFNYTQSGVDYEKLVFSSQYIGSEGTSGYKPPIPPQDKVGDIDFASSILFYSKKVWFGAAVDHLLKPEISLYLNGETVPIKYSAFGGVELVRKGRLLKPIDETLTFAFLFRRQYVFNQLDIGLYWHKMPIVLGVWLRGLPKLDNDNSDNMFLQVGDAISILAGYKLDKFSIGYSYDFTISRLVTSTHGSHEVSLVFKFKTKRKKKITAIPCPEF